MASEDSDQVGPGLPAVHRLSDLDDVQETRMREVIPLSDHAHAQSEAVEVHLLRSLQTKCLEEGDDLREQLVPPSNHVPMQVLAMIVVPTIDDDLPCSEEALQPFEACQTSLALHYRELMRDLVAGSVADSPGPRRLPDKADGEASLRLRTLGPSPAGSVFPAGFLHCPNCHCP
jgi:hypothetical protein